VLTAFVVQDFRVVKRVKTEQIQTDLATLADQVAALVHANTLTTLPKLLSDSSKEHGIVTAVVLAPNGNILAGHPNTIDSLQNFYAQANLDNRRQFGHVVYQSVLNWQGQAQGTLLVGVNNTDVEMRLFYMLQYAIWVFLLAIALAFLVGGCVQKIVSAPLKSLQKLSQNIIDFGDYSLRAPVGSQDELGQLSVAVNRMLAQIEQRDTMLEKQVMKTIRVNHSVICSYVNIPVMIEIFREIQTKRHHR
jgi:methyl-accepting chemotaxis protein